MADGGNRIAALGFLFASSFQFQHQQPVPVPATSNQQPASVFMSIPCTLIPGDGIGPDITDATLAILEAAGANFDWDRQVAGAAGVAAKGTPMPDETL